MIIIENPRIEHVNGKVYLKAFVKDEGEDRRMDLWYAVEKEYGQYFVSESADAFLLPMLLRAVVSKQSIQVNALLSERLFHNVNNSVLRALNVAWNQAPTSFKHIRAKDVVFWGGAECDLEVRCQKTTLNDYAGEAVATGCSLGVDSFSVIKKYLLDKTEYPSYRLTHFTCFNVGAFGTYNTDNTRNAFLKAVERTKDFAKQLNVPVVSVDSNVHEFYPELDFNWSHAFLNMGCALSLQKLWGKYLYASGYALDYLSLNMADTAFYEPYLLPHLSTESTMLVPADSNKSRSEKIKFIMNDAIVQQNLNVCLKDQFSNNGTIEYDDNGKLNCGHCPKCLRTMAQLDIYGKLNDYSGIFNLEDWEKIKPGYLLKLYCEKDHNKMFSDIISTITDDYVDTNEIKKKACLHKYLKKLRAVVKLITHPFQ